MELYNSIIDFLDTNLISCLTPIVLTLILVEQLFKNRFETIKGLILVRWTIVLYTLIVILFSLIGMAMPHYPNTFTNRATGPYAWGYWIMVVSTSLLPFSLLYKKLGTNFLYVLLVAFFMKIGAYIELFVIFTTSLQSDYLPENWGYGHKESTVSTLYRLGLVVLQGIVIAILIVGLFEMAKRKKTVQHNEYEN